MISMNDNDLESTKVLMIINGNNLESTKIVLIHTKNTWQMK